MLKIRGKEMNAKTLAKHIEISLVKPETTLSQIKELVDTCIKYEVNACAVNSNHLEYIVERLEGTGIKPDIAIDFPFGTGTIESKVREIEDALKKGAKLFDPVIEFGAIKTGDHKKVVEQIKACVAAAAGHETRFIIEVPLLTEDEIMTACKCVVEGGGTYVKTATGLNGGPDMPLVKKIADYLENTDTKLKIAGTGPFWTTAVALGCLAAGAEIIGTRAGDRIIDELPVFESIFRNIEII